MNLDREIVEKVMGWKYIEHVDGTKYWERPNGDKCWLIDFSPSRNIRPAMEVEAEMFRRGFQFELWHEPAGYYRAEFYKSESTGKARSESLPEAICRAALAALK